MRRYRKLQTIGSGSSYPKLHSFRHAVSASNKKNMRHYRNSQQSAFDEQWMRRGTQVMLIAPDRIVLSMLVAYRVFGVPLRSTASFIILFLCAFSASGYTKEGSPSPGKKASRRLRPELLTGAEALEQAKAAARGSCPKEWCS